MQQFSKEGTVTVERWQHVLVIGLDNAPKYNAFDIKMMHDLAAAYGELEQDDDLRCAVLHGNGEHFTSGIDLEKWMPNLREGRFLEIPEGGIDPLRLRKPYLSKPVVAAVHGWCLTIGIELMLACDVRIAARDTRFGQIEVKRGIYPLGGATFRLPREIGWANAMRYMLTGDEFTADDAYRMGLVQELTEPGQQLAAALRMANTISQQAPLGVYATLSSARLAIEAGEDVAASQIMPDLMGLIGSEDATEGVQSFIERREAQFKGR